MRILESRVFQAKLPVSTSEGSWLLPKNKRMLVLCGANTTGSFAYLAVLSVPKRQPGPIDVFFCLVHNVFRGTQKVQNLHRGRMLGVRYLLLVAFGYCPRVDLQLTPLCMRCVFVRYAKWASTHSQLGCVTRMCFSD